MAKGTLSGVIAGTMVSALALGTASVVSEGPLQRETAVSTLEVPKGSGFETLPDNAVTEAADDASVSRVAAPQPDDLSALGDDAVETAAQPETDQPSASLDAPDNTEQSGSVEVQTDSPVLTSQQTDAPEAPQSEEELSISTEPAQPVQPAITDDTSAFPSEDLAEAEQAVQEPEPTEQADDETVAQLEDEVGDAEQSATNAPEISLQTDVEPIQSDISETESASLEAEVDVTKESQPDVQVDTPELTAPQVTEPDLAEPDVALPDVAEPSQPKSDEVEENTVVAGLVAETEPSGEISGTIDDLAPNVTTDRLPSVGSDPEAAALVAQPDGGELDIVALDPSLPPLKRFAASFENPDEKPLLAIVLIDDGSTRLGLDALERFPYPLSFAVDTGWSGAGQAMQSYRDAGFEVLAMVDLPPEAGATDTEVSMESYLSRVPEAVAVMEGVDTGLQSNREATAQLAQILNDSGHGLVMLPNGLNTAQKLIAREGVPSISVFRDFDAKGQNASVIRRFLDQAAFKAGQEQAGVVMVGRLRAETISALLVWGLQDRASRVALAPVSAVLSAE